MRIIRSFLVDYAKKMPFVDNDEETLVNLPSGKISKKGERVTIRSQTSTTCMLYAMRRIATFTPGAHVNDTSRYEAFRFLKKTISSFKNFSSLLAIFKELCNQLNINTNHAAETSPTSDKENMTLCGVLYEKIISQALFPLSQHYAKNDCPNEKSFGVVSSDPSKLIV